MKIRTRLTICFLSCSIIPLLLVAAVNYSTATSSLKEVSKQAITDIENKSESFLQSQQALRADQVEAYFNQIRDQALTFADNRMVVEAMKQLPYAFSSYREEKSLESSDVESLREGLLTYYTDDFAKEYASQNRGSNANVKELTVQLDEDSIALQHAYIYANSHPMGSKHLLDTAGDETEYDCLHEVVHPVIRNYLDKFGYYDIFLVDSLSGDIVYSVFKELDYTTSLKDGPYAKSNIGEVFRKANQLSKGEFAFVDFENYKPSYEAPASFIATPIYDGDEKQGIAIFQMPVDRIIALMEQRTGLGESGETILVGSNKLPRSNSHFLPESHNLVNAFRNPSEGKIDTQSTQLALAGKTGVHTATDYRGKQVLAAYGPVDILGVRWCLTAKMDTEEAFAASKVMDTTTANASSSLFSTSCKVFVSSVIGTLIIAWFLINSIDKPIKLLVSHSEKMTAGDLTSRVKINSNDELGELAKSFNNFTDRMQTILKQVTETCTYLSTASDELSGTATDLKKGSQQTGEQSTMAASAAEELSVTMSRMSSNGEEMSENVRSVATATEDMTGKIAEIAKNAEQSAQVADKATQLAKVSDKKVSGLGEAADEIGKVTEVIQDIAEQTNLLALNATIEAARAGEAGKGFAVVAAEVKELAKQTANATGDIRQRIESIQDSTTDAVGAIKEITTVITEVNEVSRNIAESVKEQSITTQGISERIQQTSTAVDLVTTSVTESAIASQEITKNIACVDNEAKLTAKSAIKTDDSGIKVAELSSSLQELVSNFTL